MADNQQLHIYTDGGYDPHSDIGGWAYIIYLVEEPENLARFTHRHLNHLPKTELLRDSGWQKNTSSLEMELFAAEQALLSLENLKPINNTTDCSARLLTDAQIILEGLQQKYPLWCANHWQLKSGKTVSYKSLWQSLKNLTDQYAICWQWVKSHSGLIANESVDQLATQAILDKKTHH